MALTITISQLSQAVGQTVTGSPAPPYLAILTRQLAVAGFIIEAYVNVDGCPDEVKNLAAIRFVGYWRQAEFANSSRNVSTPESAFRNSGARDMLSKWRVPVHAVVR